MATELNPSLPNSPPQPLPQIPPTPLITDTPLTGPPPKRHRRPSVRLGDIGDPSPSTLRTSKPHPKSSKSRPLTNLNPSLSDGHKSSLPPKKPRTHDVINRHDDLHFDHCDGVNLSLSNCHKSPTKHFINPPPPSLASQKPRIRVQDHADDVIHKDDDVIHKNDDVDFDDYGEGFKDFDPEGSGGSDDDVGLLDAWHGHNRRSTRVSDSRADMGLDSFPESDSRNRGGSGTGLDDGVRNWLVGLGLGRYEPVFEIHEVDEEVLPHLTLDDLKHMGINAVGTRRKLYFAIQKLRKSALS